MSDQQAYRKAKRRVATKLSFYIHLTVYIAIIMLLLIINLMTSTEYLWFKWPLIGWGLGIFFHAVVVFVFFRGAGITEEMIEKEMKKESLNKE